MRLRSHSCSTALVKNGNFLHSFTEYSGPRMVKAYLSYVYSPRHLHEIAGTTPFSVGCRGVVQIHSTLKHARKPGATFSPKAGPP